ncbi:MAG: hypothetical protein QXD40_04370 [Desulfurococcaceae archaeon]
MDITIGGFKVIKLYEEVPGWRLGVVHMPIIKAAFSMNIDSIRHVIRYAGKIGVKTLVLPPFMPYGVIPRTLNDVSAINAISVNKKNPYIRILRRLSRLNLLSLVSPHVLEKSRIGPSISNIFIDGETGTCRFFSRKIALSAKELELGIRPGSKLDIISDNYLRYTVLLEEDLLMPELARFLAFTGVDVIITSTCNGVLEGMGLVDLLRSLQVFVLAPIVHVGSVVGGVSNRFVSTSTLIAVPNGELFEYSGNEGGAIITIPLKTLKESRKTSGADRFALALKILARYLRNINVTETKMPVRTGSVMPLDR